MRKLLLLGVTAATFGLAGAVVQCGGTAESITAEPGSPGPVPTFGGGSPTATWGQQLRDDKGLASSAAAADGEGNLYVAGALYGTSDLGLGPLTSAGGADVFVAKLDTLGHPVWAKRFGDAKDQFVHGAATDPGGNVVIAGSFAGTLDFGKGAPLSAAGVAASALTDAAMPALGTSDAFVAKLDRDGGLMWAVQFGGAGATAKANAVSVGATGDIAVTGSFDHVVSFGREPYPAAGPTGAFVTLLDPTGRTVWTRSWGDGLDMEGTSVAVDTSGDVLATGTFAGTVDFGAGPLISHGGRDVFVVKLSRATLSLNALVPNPDGRTLWSKGFGDQWDDYAAAIAVDGWGNVVTLGQYTGTVDLGTGPVAASGGRFFGSSDVFVAKYDRAGQASWAHHYGAADRVDWADALALDSTGNVYFSARIFNPVIIGGCLAAPTLAEGWQGQAIVAKVDAGGHGVCIQRYGDGAWSQVRSLVAHPVRGLLMAGAFDGTLDLAQGPLVSTEVPSGFIAHEDAFPVPLL